MHNTRDCHKYEKDGLKTADFCATYKGGKKSNHAKNPFVQMTKKLEKLKKEMRQIKETL
jgi:hypothetical protein